MSHAEDALISEIYRDKVAQARAIPPGERAMDGLRLYSFAAHTTLSGIHAQNPAWDDAVCREELARRLALRERRETREMAA